MMDIIKEFNEFMKIFNSEVHIKSTSDYYDYCFIFKYENGHVSKDNQKIIQLMRDAGLKLFSYLSVQKDELIVLVTAEASVLLKFADTLNYSLLLNKDKVRTLLSEGLKDSTGEYYKIKPIDIPKDPSSRFGVYDFIYGEYRASIPNDLYDDLSHYTQSDDQDDDEKKSLNFSSTTRLKLIYLLLTSPVSQGGCDIPINKFVLKKRVLAFFPIHSNEKNILISNVKQAGFLNFPLDDFKQYFGEKVALYFVFMYHIMKWTLIPSLAGVAYQILILATNDPSHDALPAYGLFLCLWFVFMFENWKRKEATNALRWGMSNFEMKETARPEFKGILTKSYITGEDTIYYPESSYHSRLVQSSILVSSMIFLIIGVVVGIYIIRFSLQGSIGESASTIASILNTVQITVFNILYGNLAYFLTTRENHRTDTKFEDSLILKSFSFQFINSYSSFFFLAFIAQYLDKPDGVDDDSVVGQCGASTCMPSLTTNLAILFGTRIFVNNVIDLATAYSTFITKLRNESKNIASNVVLTNPEFNYYMNPFSIINENIKNYSDCAIQFGFSSLFVMALPCATFLNLISSAVKVRLTVFKYTKLYQRPILTGAQDIGTWTGIFNFIIFASVGTNSALTFFSLDVFNYLELPQRIWLFLGFQWILLGIQLLIQYFVDDVPQDVQDQLEKTEFIVSKIIEKKYDEELTKVSDFENNIQEKVDEIDDHAPQKKKNCIDFIGDIFPDCILSKIRINDRVKFKSVFDENFDYDIKTYVSKVNAPPSNRFI